MCRLMTVLCLLLFVAVALVGAQPTDHRGVPLDDYDRHEPGALMYIVGTVIVVWIGYNLLSIFAWLGRSAGKRLRDDPKMRSRLYQLAMAGVIVLLAIAR